MGVFENNDENRFIKLFQSLSPNAIKNGKVIKTIAFDDMVTVKKVYRKIDSQYLYRLYVYSQEGRLKRIVEPHELVDILQRKAPYERVM